MSEESKKEKTPWGEFQSRVRELTKLGFKDNVKLSSFLKNEKNMKDWTDIEILQRALYWSMNVYEKSEEKVKEEKVKEEKVKEEKVKEEKVKTPKVETFEIDTDFKGLTGGHLVAKNPSLKDILFKKVKDFYITKGKVENLTNPAPKNYRKNRENISEEDIDKIHIYGIKCFQDVSIFTSFGMDTGFSCFEDNKTISDNSLRNVILKEKNTKGFVCVGKLENLTNPYNGEICNLIELTDDEKNLMEEMGYKYDYTKYKKNLDKKEKKKEPKVETPKVETPKVETPKVETPKVETPKVETPKVETPKVETPKVEILDEESIPLHIKKKNIPKYIKTLVWNKYIGDGIAKSKCICCRETEIRNTSFHCGHVLSEKEGGDLNINNLRPVCSSCNLGMGTRDMRSFTKEFFGWDV
jgi:hypothetical protein